MADSESNTSATDISMTDNTNTTTDSEEKKDTVAELPDLPKDKSMVVQGDPDKISNVELLTLKTKGIVIDEAKASKSPAIPKDSDVDSIYRLRSGYKGKGLDAASAKRAARKRKKEKKSDVYQGPDPDSEEACKRFKKGRNDDDGMDKDGAGAGARTTRSSTRKRKQVSV